MNYLVDEIRAEIAELDQELIEILGERRRLVADLASWKRSLGMPVEDAGREEWLRNRYARLAERHGLDQRFVQGIFDRVWLESKNMQERRRRAG